MPEADKSSDIAPSFVVRDGVLVLVNGELMNHGSKATATSGKIALQAEGSKVEFQKVELTPLK